MNVYRICQSFYALCIVFLQVSRHPDLLLARSSHHVLLSLLVVVVLELYDLFKYVRLAIICLLAIFLLASFRYFQTIQCQDPFICFIALRNLARVFGRPFTDSFLRRYLTVHVCLVIDCTEVVYQARAPTRRSCDDKMVNIQTRIFSIKERIDDVKYLMVIISEDFYELPLVQSELKIVLRNVDRNLCVADRDLALFLLLAQYEV